MSGRTSSQFFFFVLLVSTFIYAEYQNYPQYGYGQQPQSGYEQQQPYSYSQPQAPSQPQYPYSYSQQPESPPPPESTSLDPILEKPNFEGEETFIDIPDAMRSKAFVQRSILSTAIKESSRMRLGRPYLNHLMGFDAVLQHTAPGVQWMKYVSGIQALSVGYVSTGGHAVELGVEFSALSTLYAGYRLFIRPNDFSVWPFLGGGVGREVSALGFIDGPYEAQLYNGRKTMLFGTFGILIPLVDIGLKAELRFNFFGSDRLVFTQGIGAILFL